MNPRNLTREYIEQLSNIEPHCFETDREEQWFNIGLQYGLEAADANPKSLWISVEDDLPCNHEELLDNDSYTKNVLVTLSWEDDPKKRHIGIRRMGNKIGSFDVGWHWQDTAYYKVTHWMVLPDLPTDEVTHWMPLPDLPTD